MGEMNFNEDGDTKTDEALTCQAKWCVIGWQPIETAPKDGIEIDLWHTPYNGTPRRVCDVWWASGWWRNDKGFLENMSFTHWMQKPQPPITPAAQTNGAIT